MSFLARSEIQERIEQGELIKTAKEDGHAKDPGLKFNQASLDLRLGQEIYMVGNAAPQVLTKSSPYATLVPGQFAILTTEETISIPKDILAFISLKSTFKFQGLVNISGFHVDPTSKVDSDSASRMLDRPISA